MTVNFPNEEVFKRTLYKAACTASEVNVDTYPKTLEKSLGEILPDGELVKISLPLSPHYLQFIGTYIHFAYLHAGVASQNLILHFEKVEGGGKNRTDHRAVLQTNLKDSWFTKPDFICGFLESCSHSQKLRNENK